MAVALTGTLKRAVIVDVDHEAGKQRSFIPRPRAMTISLREPRQRSSQNVGEHVSICARASTFEASHDNSPNVEFSTLRDNLFVAGILLLLRLQRIGQDVSVLLKDIFLALRGCTAAWCAGSDVGRRSPWLIWAVLMMAGILLWL